MALEIKRLHLAKLSAPGEREQLLRDRGAEPQFQDRAPWRGLRFSPEPGDPA